MGVLNYFVLFNFVQNSILSILKLAKGAKIEIVFLDSGVALVGYS
jgi:hypothetical protein